MVIKRTSPIAVITALAVAMMAAVPVLGAYEASDPDPLAKDGTVRVQDVAAVSKAGGTGPVVAVGWRQRADPGELFVTYSTDGGSSYLKSNGVLRKFRVAGDGTRGLSVDICGGRVWAASVANFPGDDTRDRDVLLTSRTIGGVAGQAFVTQSTVDRVVSNASIGCIGNKLLAVAWLERSGAKSRARLLLRSLEPLGETAAVRKVFGLGAADVKGGIAVDASSEAVHVVWTAGVDRNLAYTRFAVSSDQEPVITREETKSLASDGIYGPELSVRGPMIAVAFTDAGKVKTKISSDNGVSFGPPAVIVGTGTSAAPSLVHSVDMIGPRIVIEATASKGTEQTPRRIQSSDSGTTWDTRGFGHVGARMGALWKSGTSSSLLAEAWQNNAAGPDTLRAQYQR